MNIKQAEEFQRLLKLIEAHKQLAKSENDLISEAIRWYNGEFHGGEKTDGDTAVAMHSNYSFALLDSMSASLVPQNPRPHCKPRIPDAQDGALMTERVLERDSQATRLDQICRRAVRWAGLARRGAGKVVWSETSQRPCAYVLDPRRLWWDFDVQLDQSGYTIEVTPMKAALVDRRIKKGEYKAKGRPNKGGVFPKWLQGKHGTSDEKKRDKLRGLFEWFTVYEIHLIDKGEVWHIAEGSAAPLLYSDEHLYNSVPNNYVCLSFHDNLIDERGMSDVLLTRNLQIRANELDQLEMEHVLRTIPFFFFDKRAFDSDDLDAIEAAEPGDMIGVSPTEGRKVSEVFWSSPTPGLSPDFTRARQNVAAQLQFLTGLADWLRGLPLDTETATDAALTEMGVRNRMTLRGAEVDNFQKAIFEKMLLLRIEKMGPSEVIHVNLKPSDGATTEVRHGDLVADLDIEIIAYDPLEYNKPLRIAQLLKLRAQLAGAPYVDWVRLDRLIIGLHDEDPSLIVSGPEAPADAAIAAEQDLAQLAGAPENGGPLPPEVMPT